MGSRLRRFKAKMRGQKLSDGKALCGKNRLTEASIDQLQTLWPCHLKNLSSVKDMQQGIWEIFLHKISTDENPQHGFCPSGLTRGAVGYDWSSGNPNMAVHIMTDPSFFLAVGKDNNGHTLVQVASKCAPVLL
ncbi:uncharacterized protein TNCV_1765561 [Trichonephila clavipes]|nr:uncharacterized protein TNCV_1765561 [Trichonephila clavipes]